MLANEHRNNLQQSGKGINTENNDTGRVLSEVSGAEGSSRVDSEHSEGELRQGSGEGEAVVRGEETGEPEADFKHLGRQDVVAGREEPDAGNDDADGELHLSDEVSEGEGGVEASPDPSKGRGVGARFTDKQGNAIDENGKLITEKVNSIAELTDEDFSSPSRSVELPDIPQNVSDAIGADGKPVVIKQNVFRKNRNSHKELSADDSRKILKAVLYSPNLYGQNQKVTRPYNWILIHLADKNSAVVVEVDYNKDNVEIVNWHYLRDSSLKQKERQAIEEGGLILTLNDSAAGNTSDNLSSEGKDTQSSENKQEKGAGIADNSVSLQQKEDSYEVSERVPQGKLSSQDEEGGRNAQTARRL